MQLVAKFHDLANVYGRNLQPLFGDAKIRKRLLLLGIDLKQYDVFGIVLANNHSLEKFAVGVEVEVATEDLQLRVEAERVFVLPAEDGLISVKRGESL